MNDTLTWTTLGGLTVGVGGELGKWAKGDKIGTTLIEHQ